MSFIDLKMYLTKIIHENDVLRKVLRWDIPGKVQLVIPKSMVVKSDACMPRLFQKLVRQGQIVEDDGEYAVPFKWDLLTSIVFKSLQNYNDHVFLMHAINYFRFVYIIAILRFVENKMTNAVFQFDDPRVVWITKEQAMQMRHPFTKSKIARITGNNHFSSDIDITFLNHPAKAVRLVQEYHSKFFEDTNIGNAFDINLYAVNFCIARSLIKPTPRTWEVYSRGMVIVPNQQNIRGFILSRLRLNSCKQYSRPVQLKNSDLKILSGEFKHPELLTTSTERYVEFYNLKTYKDQLVQLFKVLESRKQITHDALRLMISHTTMLSIDQYFTVSTFKHVVAHMIEGRSLLMMPYEYCESIFENFGFLLEIFCKNKPCMDMNELLKKTIKYMVRVYHALWHLEYKGGKEEYKQFEKFERVRKQGSTLDVPEITQYFGGITEDTEAFKRYIVDRYAPMIHDVAKIWIAEYPKCKDRQCGAGTVSDEIAKFSASEILASLLILE
jgi:hypothetical protein